MPFQNLNNVLPDVELWDFQREGMQKVFSNQKMLLAFDTGTGKTFTYAGIVRGLLNRNPDKKHVLVIINDSITQVPRDVSRLVRVAVEAFDGTEESAGRLRFFWDRTSILILTMEAFRVFGVVKFLFDHLMEIESFTIDEAHHCSNWDTSDTAFMIRALAQYVPYVIELSATPMTRVSQQYYRLMNILDRRRSRTRDETYVGAYVDRYMSVNRRDYDIKGQYVSTLVEVQPTMEQLQPQHGIIFKKLKGTGATPQVKALIETVQQRLAENKRVIVYTHYHDSRRWIETNFSEHDISFVSLHGKVVKKVEREGILNAYREGKVDVLITSVTESLNIDADVVIFYEFTTLVKQVIGRAHRGLTGKPLEIVFIITKDTDEVSFFLKYIYERSLTVQKLLMKDYSELVEIGKKVKKLELDD